MYLGSQKEEQKVDQNINNQDDTVKSVGLSLSVTPAPFVSLSVSLEVAWDKNKTKILASYGHGVGFPIPTANIGVSYQEAVPLGNNSIGVGDLSGQSTKATVGGYGAWGVVGGEVIGSTNDVDQNPTYESTGFMIGVGNPGFESSIEQESTFDVTESGPGEESHLYGSGIVIPGF